MSVGDTAPIWVTTAVGFHALSLTEYRYYRVIVPMSQIEQYKRTLIEITVHSYPPIATLKIWDK